MTGYNPHAPHPPLIIHCILLVVCFASGRACPVAARLAAARKWVCADALVLYAHPAQGLSRSSVCLTAASHVSRAGPWYTAPLLVVLWCVAHATYSQCFLCTFFVFNVIYVTECVARAIFTNRTLVLLCSRDQEECGTVKSNTMCMHGLQLECVLVIGVPAQLFLESARSFLSSTKLT